jgi:hypothetical protein
MRWQRKLRILSPLRPIGKRNRPKKQRVLLHLEELESRALPSASSATPIQPATAPATNEAVHPMLTVSPQHVSPQQSSGVPGYTPQQIRQIYGFDQLPQVNGQTINGSGETIAIVDAYYDPYITSDANTFSTQFGLPLFNSTGGPTLTVVASGGGPASGLPQDTTGAWPLETSLDVEWAHAMAPQANIILVEAPNGNNAPVFAATQYAASLPGVNVVSMSWGTNEFSGETNYDYIFQPKSSTNPNGSNPGVTFVAASGDSGAGAIYPAASPYVLSVGGTTLGGSTSTSGSGTGTGTGGSGTSSFGTSGFGTSGFGIRGLGTFASYGPGYSAFARAGGGLYRGAGALTVTPETPPPPRDPPASSPPSSPPSSYPGESAWSGSGGGPSSYEGYPSYQYNQPWIAQTYGYPYNVEVTNNSNGSTSDYSARMTPDVAYNAAPSTGYAIYDSTPSAEYGTGVGWNEVGGTSAAAPQWSAIIALADQERGLIGSGASATPLDTNQVLTTLYNTLGSSPTNSTYTSVFHDITTGSNGYAAATGYDLSTGLGTPIVNNLVPLLAGTSIAQGGLPTITGSGYGGGGGTSGSGFGSSSSGGSGSSSFGSSSLYGFSASSQPGGGLYAGSASISIVPGAAGANGLNGQPGGSPVASTAPQAAAPVMPSAASVTFSVSTIDAVATSAATGENNLLGQASTLMPASPVAAAGSTPSAASTNALAAQSNDVFGASGWNGSALLGRLGSLDLPAPEIGPSTDDDLSQNTEDVDDQSADGAIVTNDDVSGEDLFAYDVLAPALRDEGDAGESGEGGEGGGDG